MTLHGFVTFLAVRRRPGQIWRGLTSQIAWSRHHPLADRNHSPWSTGLEMELGRSEVTLRPRRRTSWLVLLACAIAMALVAVTLYASRGADVSDPPDDCWNGALADDPIHCYALAELQRDGVIEVEGVYQIRAELNVYFAVPPDEERPWKDWIADALRERADKFLERHPDQAVPYFCLYETPDPRECTLGFTYASSRIVPWQSPYDVITLHGGRRGGAPAVRGLGVVDAALARSPGRRPGDSQHARQFRPLRRVGR